MDGCEICKRVELICLNFGALCEVWFFSQCGVSAFMSSSASEIVVLYVVLSKSLGSEIRGVIVPSFLVIAEALPLKIIHYPFAPLVDGWMDE